MKRAAVLVALLLAGCARSGSQPETPVVGRFGKLPGKPDARAWLSPQAKGGAEVLAVEGGVAGDRVTSLLELPEADCAVAIARATSTVDDVDLFAHRRHRELAYQPGAAFRYRREYRGASGEPYRAWRQPRGAVGGGRPPVAGRRRIPSF